MRNIPLDALPDLSDTQVIVYSRWDRSPDIIEDQVSYPIITALLGAPKVKAIRGYSDFGFSYVYVIFEDGTDIYWARTRVLEYLSKISAQLPAGVKTELGPDATSLGWVFQYALVDRSGKHASDELRSYQDWFLALRHAKRARRGRGGDGGRPGPPVPGHGESRRPWRRTSCRSTPLSRPCARATTTWAADWSSCRGVSTWCEGAAT